jgi:1-phosphofructokinase family hexose kinase
VTVVEDSGRVSQYLEPGPHVTPAEMDAFRAAFRSALAQADWLVLSGSTPDPACDVLYPECIALAKSRGIPTLLDSSASALRAGVAAAPFAVKPNAQEAALFLGHEARTSADALQAAVPILAQGVQVAVISLGPQGAVAVSRSEAWHAQPPEIAVRKAIACGDSLVGALAYAWRRGLALPEVLRWGVAAGTANATVWDPAGCTRAEIEALVPRVTVSRLPV